MRTEEEQAEGNFVDDADELSEDTSEQTVG